MQVTVKELGAVKEGTFELKPLTVFVGPNNSGKTWTAYTIGSLFSADAHKIFLNYYLDNQPEDYSFIENVVQQVLDEGHSKINIFDAFNQCYKVYLKDLTTLTPSNLPKVLMSSQLNFDKLILNLETSGCFDNSLEIIKTWKIESSISVDKKGNAILSCHKEKDNFELYFITETEGKIKDIPVKIIRRYIALQIFQLLHRSLYPNVYFLPSDRTGLLNLISMDGFGQKEVVDEKEEGENKKINRRMLRFASSYPLGSLFNITWESSNEISKIERLKLAEKNTDIKNYIQLAEVLENDILEGSVETLRKPDGSLHIISKFQDKEVLDLQAASSFVKDLAPLVFYLRFVAQKGDLIIIDEPEMNLHPLAQAQCAEFLGMMVNAGLNVIITTHSPYIVDHLSNIIKAGIKAKDKNIPDLEALFYLENRNSFLSRDKVGVYFFADGTIASLLTESGYIKWGTFGEISKKLMDIHRDIKNMDDV